jgi:hypothetical protein
MLNNGNRYQLDYIVQLGISLENGTYFSKSKCFLKKFPFHRSIPEKGTLKLTIDTDACKNTKDEIKYLEHVQAFLTLKSSRRGNIVVFLTSPLGTR